MMWAQLALMALYVGAAIWDVTGSRIERRPQPIIVLGHHIATVEVDYRLPGRRQRDAPLAWCLIALVIAGTYLVVPGPWPLACAAIWVIYAGWDLIVYIRRAS